MRHPARGAVLLEVVAALTIFAFAAAAAIALLSQLAEGQQRAHQDERRVADQQRLMTAYALLSRDDLNRRLGRRAMGPYQVEVQRPEQTVYRVTIGDNSGVDLATLLYRAEPARGAPQ